MRFNVKLQICAIVLIKATCAFAADQNVTVLMGRQLAFSRLGEPATIGLTFPETGWFDTCTLKWRRFMLAESDSCSVYDESCSAGCMGHCMKNDWRVTRTGSASYNGRQYILGSVESLAPPTCSYTESCYLVGTCSRTRTCTCGSFNLQVDQDNWYRSAATSVNTGLNGPWSMTGSGGSSFTTDLSVSPSAASGDTTNVYWHMRSGNCQAAYTRASSASQCFRLPVGPPSQSPTLPPSPTSLPTATRTRAPSVGAAPSRSASPPAGGSDSFTGACLASSSQSQPCPSILGLDPSAQSCAAGGYEVIVRGSTLALEPRTYGCGRGSGLLRSDGSGTYDISLWSIPGVSVTAVPYSSYSFSVRIAYGGSSCSWTYSVVSGACIGATATSYSSAIQDYRCTVEPSTAGQCSNLLDNSLDRTCVDGGYTVNVASTGQVSLSPRSYAGCLSGSGYVDASAGNTKIFMIPGATTTARGYGNEVNVYFSVAGVGSCSYAYRVISGSCFGAAAATSSNPAPALPLGVIIGAAAGGGVLIISIVVGVVLFSRSKRAAAMTTMEGNDSPSDADGNEDDPVKVPVALPVTGMSLRFPQHNQGQMHHQQQYPNAPQTHMGDAAAFVNPMQHAYTPQSFDPRMVQQGNIQTHGGH